MMHYGAQCNAQHRMSPLTNITFLGSVVDLCSVLYKLNGFFLHAVMEGFVCLNAFLLGIFTYVLSDFHTAKMRHAHRKKGSEFHGVLRSGLGMKIFDFIRGENGRE